MPLRVVAFSCQFRCGQRVTVKKSGMQAHEAQCINNPETRSCPTCAYNYYERSEPEVGLDGGWYCEENHLEKDQLMAKNCPHWQGKEER